jgi:hypothetical protein
LHHHYWLFACGVAAPGLQRQVKLPKGLCCFALRLLHCAKYHLFADLVLRRFLSRGWAVDALQQLGDAQPI